MLRLSDLQKYFKKTKAINGGITFDKLQMAVKLLYVNHNVNIQGNVQVNNQYNKYKQDNNYNNRLNQQQIQQLLTQQKQHYQTLYQLSHHSSNPLPFCIIIPSYNNILSKLYLRNLDSIFMQQYSNFHIVYIDDASPQNTSKYIQQYIKQIGISDEYIKIIKNQKNKLALENIYNAVHNECKEGDIVMIIDGDDALIGRQVLAVYNAVYQKTKAAFVYSNYLHVTYNRQAQLGSSSQPIPMEILLNNDDQENIGYLRNSKLFFTSHLLSFYVQLFRQIKKQDLTYTNGSFYKSAYDVSICTPMIQMARKRIFYLPEITYEYRYDTGQNDQVNGQIEVSDIVFAKKPYKEIKNWQWIDNREEYLKKVKENKNKVIVNNYLSL